MSLVELLLDVGRNQDLGHGLRYEWDDVEGREERAVRYVQTISMASIGATHAVESFSSSRAPNESGVSEAT